MAEGRTVRSICVFCGSRPGADPAFAASASVGLNLTSDATAAHLAGASATVFAPTTVNAEKVEKMLEKERQLEKEIADLKRKVALGGGAGGGST